MLMKSSPEGGEVEVEAHVDIAFVAWMSNLWVKLHAVARQALTAGLDGRGCARLENAAQATLAAGDEDWHLGS